MSDHKVENESYLQDLGFIVEDRDDRRIDLVDANWDRLENLDTDEALEEHQDGTLPLHAKSGAPPTGAFATQYNLDHLEAEKQEEDFVETSMLATDPEAGAGAHDFTSDSDLDDDGRIEAVDIAGRAPGVARGFGTSVPMDIGSGGFQVRNNPLLQRVDSDQPVSNQRLSDAARGLRDVDEMGSDEELDRLADEGAREVGSSRGHHATSRPGASQRHRAPDRVPPAHPAHVRHGPR